MTAPVLTASKYEVRVTDGRSRFDSARWRCGGTAEGCGVWYSVFSQPWGKPRDEAHRLAAAHMRGPNHA